MTRVSSRRLFTLQLSALVSWRWGCVLVCRTACWFPAGISSFFLGVLNYGVKLFNFVGRYCEFSSAGVKLLFWAFQYLIAALFLLSTFGQR